MSKLCRACPPLSPPPVGNLWRRVPNRRIGDWYHVLRKDFRQEPDDRVGRTLAVVAGIDDSKERARGNHVVFAIIIPGATSC